MSWTLYRCARCGKKIKLGHEHFIGRSAYGVRCYQLVREKQIEFDIMVLKKGKHGSLRK